MLTYAVYANGTLIGSQFACFTGTKVQIVTHSAVAGGLDILKELIENGELHEALGVVPQGESLNARLENCL
jgi:hypothetical protein